MATLVALAVGPADTASIDWTPAIQNVKREVHNLFSNVEPSKEWPSEEWLDRNSILVEMGSPDVLSWVQRVEVDLCGDRSVRDACAILSTTKDLISNGLIHGWSKKDLLPYQALSRWMRDMVVLSILAHADDHRDRDLFLLTLAQKYPRRLTKGDEDALQYSYHHLLHGFPDKFESLRSRARQNPQLVRRPGVVRHVALTDNHTDEPPHELRRYETPAGPPTAAARSQGGALFGGASPAAGGSRSDGAELPERHAADMKVMSQVKPALGLLCDSINRQMEIDALRRLPGSDGLGLEEDFRVQGDKMRSAQEILSVLDEESQLSDLQHAGQGAATDSPPQCSPEHSHTQAGSASAGRLVGEAPSGPEEASPRQSSSGGGQGAAIREIDAETMETDAETTTALDHTMGEEDADSEDDGEYVFV